MKVDLGESFALGMASYSRVVELRGGPPMSDGWRTSFKELCLTFGVQAPESLDYRMGEKFKQIIASNFGEKISEAFELGFLLPAQSPKTLIERVSTLRRIEEIWKKLGLPDTLLKALLSASLEQYAKRILSIKDALLGHQLTPRVFIVHGHDEIRYEVSHYLEEKCGVIPVRLELEPNMGMTILDKLQENSDVQAAVVLMTGDDHGAKSGEVESKARARQNVILELGFFLAKLGSRRVVTLYDRGVEMPSDYYGILYIELDKHQRWKPSLRNEIAARLDFKNK